MAKPNATPPEMAASLERERSDRARVLAAYRKIANRVVLRGTIKPGKETFAAFTLPVGFRPSKAIGLTVKTGQPPYCGGLAILTNGQVAIYAPPTSAAVDLEACGFYLD